MKYAYLSSTYLTTFEKTTSIKPQAFKNALVQDLSQVSIIQFHFMLEGTAKRFAIKLVASFKTLLWSSD